MLLFLDVTFRALRTKFQFLSSFTKLHGMKRSFFVAESLAELSNCNEPHYNRRIPAKEFKKLWNTAMPKMPLYANTFFTVER